LKPSLEVLSFIDREDAPVQGPRTPMVAVSIYDERHLHRSRGPRHKKLDKFINYKLMEEEKNNGMSIANKVYKPD